MPRGYPETRLVLLTRITPSFVEELSSAHRYLSDYIVALRRRKYNINRLGSKDKSYVEWADGVIRDVEKLKKRLRTRMRRAQKKLQQDMIRR